MKTRKGGFDAFSMDDYKITEDGRIINLKWGREVKPQQNDKGYLRVQMVGRMRFVHRLVAEKYVPNPDGKPQVNHKDGNKLNNHADNLEWVTNKENRAHAVKYGLQIQGEKCPWAKLSEVNVKYIRSHPEIGTTLFAETYGVSVRTIRDIRNGKSWKNV